MTPNLFREAGEALYGARWQTALAHDLCVADRTVRRWAQGEFDIPPGVWEDIRKLIGERVLVLGHVAVGISDACLNARSQHTSN